MLSELEVCPCSYLSDPQLSRLFASSVPFWSRQRTLPTCIPECQERVFSSCPVLLLHADHTPPHLLLVIEKQEQKHECVCRALCNSREVNLSKSPALAKVCFPLQCQCFFAALGPSTAGAGNATQGLEGLFFLSCLNLLLCLQWPSKHYRLQNIHSLVGN